MSLRAAGRLPGMTPDGMGAVCWNATMSLDGFIAGPDDAMDWVFATDEPSNPVIGETIESTGALLVGRRTYEAGQKPGQPEEATEAFGGAWSGPQFVLTHRPPARPDPSVTFLSGDIAEAVATARAAAGHRNVVVLGAQLGREILEAGLMDDILILVPPSSSATASACSAHRRPARCPWSSCPPPRPARSPTCITASPLAALVLPARSAYFPRPASTRPYSGSRSSLWPAHRARPDRSPAMGAKVTSPFQED
jgi:dihydrofolate reductase